MQHLRAQLAELSAVLRGLVTAVQGGGAVEAVTAQAEELLAGQPRRPRLQWTARELEQDLELALYRETAESLLGALGESAPAELAASVAQVLSGQEGAVRLEWEHKRSAALASTLRWLTAERSNDELGMQVARMALERDLADLAKFERTHWGHR